MKTKKTNYLFQSIITSGFLFVCLVCFILFCFALFLTSRKRQLVCRSISEIGMQNHCRSINKVKMRKKNAYVPKQGSKQN